MQSHAFNPNIREVEIRVILLGRERKVELEETGVHGSLRFGRDRGSLRIGGDSCSLKIALQSEDEVQGGSLRTESLISLVHWER